MKKQPPLNHCIAFEHLLEDSLRMRLISNLTTSSPYAPKLRVPKSLGIPSAVARQGAGLCGSCALAQAESLHALPPTPSRSRSLKLRHGFDIDSAISREDGLLRLGSSSENMLHRAEPNVTRVHSEMTRIMRVLHLDTPRV